MMKKLICILLLGCLMQAVEARPRAQLDQPSDRKRSRAARGGGQRLGSEHTATTILHLFKVKEKPLPWVGEVPASIFQ